MKIFKTNTTLPYYLAAFLLTLLLGLSEACHTTRPGTGTNRYPNSKPGDKNKYEPMDTVRWTTPGNTKPPIGGKPTKPINHNNGSGQTYHIALLLPFLTNQANSGTVPDKSSLALQFYAGARIALQQLSEEASINLVTDIYDTQASDADFQLLTNNPKLENASVFIGPIRSSHVSTFANWTKAHRKILISPETPSGGLTKINPDFVQTNPSLRAHCSAITRYVRKRNSADAVTLICKEKERDRLPYFQEANAELGGGRLQELVVPDATLNFDKIDLKPYIKAGKTSVFILPTWASQDFVMAFFRKLKTAKGNAKVEVYGMPQWKNFESIEAEYLTALNVHVSASSYINYSAKEVKDFQQKFYELTGTIPDDDGFNGYDVTLWTGRMLAQYGLAFPDHLEEGSFEGLHTQIRFSPIIGEKPVSPDDSGRRDYWENTYVHILKYGPSGFAPVD